MSRTNLDLDDKLVKEGLKITCKRKKNWSIMRWRNWFSGAMRDNVLLESTLHAWLPRD